MYIHICIFIYLLVGLVLRELGGIPADLDHGLYFIIL